MRCFADSSSLPIANPFLDHSTAPTFSLVLLLLAPDSHNNMYFILLLVMTFLARFLKASDQYLNNLQPGCFPVPSLFENISTAPGYWPHGTPLLPTLAKSADISHFVKRVSGSWDGWQNVHNIFALYAWSLLNLAWYTR